MIWWAIVIAAALFLVIVWFGRWLNRNKHGYPLPALEVDQGGGDADGVPVRRTEDGLRFAAIAKGTCPHCKKETKFLAGPVGGMSQNIQCEKCNWWFNVTVFGMADDGVMEGIAQDIGFK